MQDLTNLQTAAIYYVEIEFLCAVFMQILLFSTLRDVGRNVQRRNLIHLLISVIAYCFVDSIWMLVYGNVIPRNGLTRSLSNVLLYISMGFCSHDIYSYLEGLMDEIRGIKAKRKKLYWLLIFEIVIIIANPWLNIIFSIDSKGDMYRTVLYPPFMLVLYTPVIIALVKSIIIAVKTENEFSRRHVSLVTVYTIPVLVGATLHFRWLTHPTFVIGFSVATVIIYIALMREQVSRDELTGITNRRSAERYFHRKINEINNGQSNESIYLLMLDVNRFKMINDTYGHTEGDRALVLISDALKNVCAGMKTRCMICRFGGDEFVIGLSSDSEDEVENLCDYLRDALCDVNISEKLPYELSISMGYKKYEKKMKNLKNFIAAADKLMYENKKKLKGTGNQR